MISIIVPVYNSEKYIDRCLDSILNQTYKDLEIVLVNDGSNDQSLKILENYALRDTRIKVVNQENKGVAAARNTVLITFSTWIRMTGLKITWSSVWWNFRLMRI